MDGERFSSLTGVRAALNYLVPNGERPYSYQYDPPPGRPLRSGNYQPQVVTIANGRLQPDAELDVEGYTFVKAPTAIDDFYAEGALPTAYYPEVERVVAEATGASLVIAFDHNIRNGGGLHGDRPGRPAGIREPVARVHNDFTLKSAPERARRVLGDDAADRLLQRRYAFINLWRPIREPLVDQPLAVCDARSVAHGDLIAQDLIYRDRVGETYAVAHNPAHRWVYFPEMRREEALLIKCFDSADDRARLAPHSAFADPSTPADAPPRESIETRTIAFF
jgi:hypothetical protein